MNHENEANDHLSKEFSEVCQQVTSLGELEDIMPKIQELIDVFPFYIILVDSTHHILMVNKALTQIFGLDREHIIGKYCPKVIHSLDVPFPGCPLEEAIEKGHSIEKEFFDTNSGRWVKSAIYWTGWKTSNDLDIFVHMISDITEIKKANEELERNYEILKVINSLLSLSQQDISLEELLKHSLELILSIPWLALESKGAIFLVEDTPDVLVMKTEHALSESIQKTCIRVPFGKCLCGQAALKKELQFSDCIDDRHEITYQGIKSHGHYCVPILYADMILGVLNLYLSEGHHRDKKEEEFLVAFVSALASIIMHRRKESEMRTQIIQIQKMDAVGQLAGGIAHDFNNLLQVISGYSEVALSKLDDSKLARNYIEEVIRAGERATSLTRQLLAFSRRQMIQLQIFSINDLVDNMNKMLKRLIGEDIEFAVTISPNAMQVKADPGQIEQVIMNLIVNARDAMPAGGRLTIKTENIILDESQSRLIPESLPGEYVCISVSDTGVGMSKEIIQHIFEPFFSTKGVKGTGLGLSVVYGIAKQHDGWINVYSEPGEGSVFRLYLPIIITEKSEAKTRARLSLAGLVGSGERILLVEDELQVHEFVTQVLQENGYVIFRASTAAEAMDVFGKEGGNIHLIFSDVVLPDKNGLQLVDQLLTINPNLQVLLSSGYTDQKSQWQDIQDRGYRFIQKPYKISDLLKAIKEAMKSDHKNQEA